MASRSSATWGAEGLCIWKRFPRRGQTVHDLLKRCLFRHGLQLRPLDGWVRLVGDDRLRELQGRYEAIGDRSDILRRYHSWRGRDVVVWDIAGARASTSSIAFASAIRM